jgi:1-acyl-sn-glycerol-3-phosphate acyltransferase
MTPTLPSALPRSGGRLTRAFGRFVLRLLRWRIVGEIPNQPKLVVIAAPHRSNWDFVVGIAAKLALGVDASWLGKHTLFRRPFGWMFRQLGGIPVDRRSAQNTVASVVGEFAAHNRLVIALAPEGTRKAGAEWKSGFWHIAHGAGVPILPVAFDWAAHTVRVLSPLDPTDPDRDMLELQQRYAGFRGPRD